MYGVLPWEWVLVFLSFLWLSSSGLHPKHCEWPVVGAPTSLPLLQSVAVRVLAGRAPSSTPGRLSGLQHTAVQPSWFCKPASVTSAHGSGVSPRLETSACMSS